MWTGSVRRIQSDVGLTQGSALSLLLLIAVVKLISRKICSKDDYGKYCTQTHGLAVVADGEANLQEQLNMFGEDGGNGGGT